jgi:hypothetical protein
MESIQQTPLGKEQPMFEHVDRKAPGIMGALAEAPIFKKQGRVQARPAVEGEVIVTKLASGAEETTNAAKAGDWVMTNPSGEQYIIGEQKFFARYEPTDEDGVYQAKGYCRAIKNPHGKPIEIMASWGSPQTGDADCMIADTCDEHGENMGGEPYLIEAAAFAETYA